MKVLWTETALADLEELHAFISADDIAAADRMVDSILKGLETAARFPDSGRRGTRVEETRELVIYPYLVVYQPKQGGIEVVAILHGSRRWFR